MTQLRSVELFSGAGGLLCGLSRAGFHHEIVVENNNMACETVRLNQRQGNKLVEGCKILEASIEDVDFSAVAKRPDLLSGGPPCQGFSIGGKHLGVHDDRNLWPWTIDAVRELEPKSFAFENVGAMATTHKDYLDYLVLALALPNEANPHGDWEVDKERLIKIFADRDPPEYQVKVMKLNAAEYGTAQARSRIFVIGTRSDIKGQVECPEITHSLDQLMADKWKNGSYWDRVGLARPEIDDAGARWMRKDNQRPAPDMFDLMTPTTRLEAYRTVRETMLSIPTAANCNEPAPRKAKAYKGHTGSPIDDASKTLRAGDHGVSGGENMIDWGNYRPEESRYEHFSVRQAAAISDFPMDYDFAGTWSDGLKQIGNAVPGNLGYVVGNEIKKALAA